VLFVSFADQQFSLNLQENFTLPRLSKPVNATEGKKRPPATPPPQTRHPHPSARATTHQNPAHIAKEKPLPENVLLPLAGMPTRMIAVMGMIYVPFRERKSPPNK
jgi:hypothetical protein